MAGEFGKFIDSKRKGRGSGGDDIKLKDIADAMGMTASYLSDIVKGRRNPPEIHILEKIAAVLQLTSVNAVTSCQKSITPSNREESWRCFLEEGM